ncbi:MAG: 6-phosphofructokinase [Phycisphaerae bacterium]|nr:6-phosphofructokinase [Phycisphaerae bacterium]
MSGSAPLKRIGILTGGGDCPGLNAVIRAVTKSAFNDHGWEVWGIEDGFLGLIVGRIRKLDREDVSNILTRGGTILGTTNKADPARFAVATDEHGDPVFHDVSDLVMENYRTFGLDAVVVVGGDGTMSGAARLIPRGFRCVGVPKTIDNDLMHTDITFGFMTAVTTATEAIDRVHTTASSHHRVMLVEIMGRNAGWLTLYSGIAGGADIVLIPEIPYDLDTICEVCHRRAHVGKCFTIIAVSEGARSRDGGRTVHKIVKDSPDPVRLGGISQILAEQIAERTHLETRATILGHIQRGGTPVAFDRVLATQFGNAAVRLLATGQFNRLVVMKDYRIDNVDIAEVADQQRTVPPDHPLVAAARSIGTSFGV